MPFGSAVQVPSTASAARWIAPTLGTFGTVGGLVPNGFEQYLLVDYRSEKPLGWEGVSRLFEQLIPLLAAHTAMPDRCWFAIWEGYGFDTSMTLIAAQPGDNEERRAVERERRRSREDDDRRNAAIRSALSGVPSFDLPNRRYYLVGGGISAASQIERPDGSFAQPPDLWWPEDRRWFVAGDTDLDWCYIGGSGELVAAVGAEFHRRTRRVKWEASNEAAGTVT